MTQALRCHASYEVFAKNDLVENYVSYMRWSQRHVQSSLHNIGICNNPHSSKRSKGHTAGVTSFTWFLTNVCWGFGPLLAFRWFALSMIFFIFFHSSPLSPPLRPKKHIVEFHGNLLADLPLGPSRHQFVALTANG